MPLRRGALCLRCAARDFDPARASGSRGRRLPALALLPEQRHPRPGDLRPADAALGDVTPCEPEGRSRVPFASDPSCDHATGESLTFLKIVDRAAGLIPAKS